jgi:pSer/pThr/pTyr-binding forkhead associated (FHA) protein
MFGLHELVHCWRRRAPASCRLVPWGRGPSDRAEGAPITAKLPAVIGRSSTADVRLRDPWVSRIHCELSDQNGIVLIRDLESRHGVFVNGERVSQQALHNGDELLLGVSHFRVELDETAPADEASAGVVEADA